MILPFPHVTDLHILHVIQVMSCRYRQNSRYKLRWLSHQNVFGDALFVGGILELPAPAQNHPFTLIGWN